MIKANIYTLLRKNLGFLLFLSLFLIGNVAWAANPITNCLDDNTPPVFQNLPYNITIGCEDALPTTIPIATDNCDTDVSITFSETKINGYCPENYTINRTWTATDNNGNTASSQQIITVEDKKTPILANIPTNTTISCEDTLP